MRYLFNTGTGRLIGATGGGTIFLSVGFRENKEAQAEAINGINIFLDTFPEGGDISEIVNEYRKKVHQ